MVWKGNCLRIFKSPKGTICILLRHSGVVVPKDNFCQKTESILYIPSQQKYRNTRKKLTLQKEGLSAEEASFCRTEVPYRVCRIILNFELLFLPDDRLSAERNWLFRKRISMQNVFLPNRKGLCTFNFRYTTLDMMKSNQSGL